MPGLAETAVAGFADGYARMAGRPAATSLHCGPGLANAIAGLHNAWRAFTPVRSRAPTQVPRMAGGRGGLAVDRIP